MNSLNNQTVSGRFVARALLGRGSLFETYQVWDPLRSANRANTASRWRPVWLLVILFAVINLSAASCTLDRTFEGRQQTNVILPKPTRTMQALPTDTPIIPTPELDFSNGSIQVVEILDQVYFQVGNQKIGTATEGDKLPIGEDVHIWTIFGSAKLGLSDGSVLMIDQHTTIWPSSIVTNANPNAEIQVAIERGNVLALTGPVKMVTMSGDYMSWSKGAVMGITFQPMQNLFRVECFGPSGNCSIKDADGLHELEPGQSQAYEGGTAGDVEAADYESWAIFGGPDMPQPTPTPTMTLTSTPTSTPTPTPTLLVKPDKPDKDQDEPKEKPKPEPPDPNENPP